MRSKYLEAGKIVNTHGIQGEVMAQSWCDDIKILCALTQLYIKLPDGSFKACKIERASPHKGMGLIKLGGIDELDAAIKLKNTVVYADREELPRGEGDHFIADLIGLPVIDIDSGVKYGILTDVSHNGANGVYEIDTGKPERSYIPAVAEFVIKIDEDEGIFIRPIEGMIE